ncbi:MAG: hypothetical protein LQ338_008245, partial [Usnochroma carphineum]
MATTETSNRWFIPDHAYRTLNGDYALTCRFANRTKREILLHDSLPAHFATLCCPPRSFLDALEALRDGYGYFFANSPTLVYADVDTSDPAHEKELKARIAGVQELETGIEKNEKVKENFIKHFADVWTEDRKNFLRRHGSRPEDADEDASKVVLEADVQAFLHATMGNPVPAVLDYIISLDNEDGEREEALMLVTAQARLPAEAQRPVLVLVNMVDTAQSRV